ncbi:hypothetical protein [Methylocystis sp. ATCC 49242]|jgi:hypothetical protein|uniref:hypothetical protein n=1 Tax=Methylocystis sp. ATCC 49242 TaxID=622637 RepID=UPI0001F87A9B|nr:hypothetical protein [Methylocystis sp. ATCC 49242]
MTSCCADGSPDWRPLNAGQRCARLIVGIVLLLLALALPWSGAGWVALAVITGWFGATHVLAAAMAYPGCPELGVAPSLLLGRWVRIGCTPWRWLDAKLRLTLE